MIALALRVPDVAPVDPEGNIRSCMMRHARALRDRKEQLVEIKADDLMPDAEIEKLMKEEG